MKAENVSALYIYTKHLVFENNQIDNCCVPKLLGIKVFVYEV